MDEEGDSLIVANEDGSHAAECSNQGQEEIRQRAPTDTMDEEGSSLIVANEDGGDAAECSNQDREEIRQRAPAGTLKEEEMAPLLAPPTLPQLSPQLLHQRPAQDLDILRVGSMTSIKVR
jgi:hypothetical protein